MPKKPIITDFDVADGFTSCFRCAVKSLSYFIHIAFLETCSAFDLCPGGLQITKQPFISFESKELTALWEQTIWSSSKQLLETLIFGIHEKLLDFESDFWIDVKRLRDNLDQEKFEDWIIQLMVYLEDQQRLSVKKKRHKLRKLCFNNAVNFDACLARFEDHFNFFFFKQDFSVFVKEVSPDIPNLVILTQLGMCAEVSTDYTSCVEVEECLEESTHCLDHSLPSSTSCDLIDGRYKGKFVSDNVINLSSRVLTASEISLLSKGLKFVPTPTSVNKARLKEELEIFGRRLRLKWFFRNDNNNGPINPFKKKSHF